VIYKILNKLFGWDYVLWENTCSKGVSRVRNDGDGVTYYVSIVYGLSIIKRSYEVIWLTCPSSKYLKNEVKK